ncbi:DUF6525 family protein [Pseudotabrizicola sp.]|nr:DUF6525 family protein [Pseudotabrizicola sp.]MDO8881885.1 DUF6525 family protein [Pseudotabrizicola sp.]MDP2082043.1 DUF6525 family protein [Pseudotabrizicola sp.]
MMRNLTSPRARWRSGNAMADHDGLPAPVREWAAQAALPWSATSLRKLWTRALNETKCAQTALARLSQAERATLRREAAKVWGDDYPQ